MIEAVPNLEPWRRVWADGERRIRAVCAPNSSTLCERHRGATGQPGRCCWRCASPTSVRRDDAGRGHGPRRARDLRAVQAVYSRGGVGSCESASQRSRRATSSTPAGPVTSRQHRATWSGRRRRRTWIGPGAQPPARRRPFSDPGRRGHGDLLPDQHERRNRGVPAGGGAGKRGVHRPGPTWAAARGRGSTRTSEWWCP
ncbi:hypothetical protein QJS66_10430 [Kocuria rhizophila]|nr:hypothetical protein QJS66_10430 [Kocuria rhizophila]